MSHEIYYTSAPEGIKRGTSGFCTVAASENIPKPLWDRLETLSAYRHQFATGGQPNPVSFAHWILGIGGKSHHVLSRICDSGVDHTQRTNAFAHHLVLEAGEIAAAVGGPAWLLEQPGVMTERWDGQVGPLMPPPPSRLAKGDIFSPSRVCRAWEAATGDAGWGGHLADLFAKSPTRPVCILFSAGQELLPLLAESIALLPPAARWNVTFNTYFTSMPTSATCLWRCCLAGTPAAQTGLRYAANGLMLDLTDRARLPALPSGDYVTMARTGQSAAAARPAVKPAQPALAELKKSVPTAKAKPGVAAPIYDPEGDAEEREIERQRERIFDFSPPPPPPASDEPAAADAMDAGTYELRGDGAPIEAVPLRSRERARPPSPPPRLIRRAEEALEEAERQAAEAAQKRRRQVLLLFLGALGAIAVGSGLVYLLNRSGAPPEPSGPTATFHPKPVETNPVRIVPDTVPDTPILATQQAPTTFTVVQTQTVTSGPVIVAPAIAYPEFLTLTTAMERPKVGTGIGERVYSLGFKAADFDPLPVSGMGLMFFSRQPGNPASSPPPPSPANGAATTYKNNTLGTLTGAPGSLAGKKGVALYWKPTGDPGLGTEMLFVGLDRSKPGLELQWHAAALQRNAEVYNYIFWTLQNSAFVLESPRTTRQQIVMPPISTAPIDFADPAPPADLTWPADFPSDVRAVEPAIDTLPAGWKADWFLDWEASIAAASRTTENANQVISFKKSTMNPKVDAWFLLTFKPGVSGGIAKVECTFAKRFQQDRDDLAAADKTLADINKRLSDLKNDPALSAFGGGIPPDLLTKQAEAQAADDAYKAALAGYNELTQFDVSFDLSDKMRLATLHFQRSRAPEAGK